jgi:acetyl esterase
MKLPDRWLGRAVGEPVTLDGQTLDVQIQALLAAAKLARVKDEAEVGPSRIAMDRDVVAVGPAPVAMRRERDFKIDVGTATAPVSLPARLYVPKTAPTSASPPLVVFFHGGGFVCGSIVSHDLAVRELAHESGAAILSVEYRLAPEHKAPTAPEDGCAAFRWARANAAALGIDGKRIGVAGDSAGGNLSAVMCHMLRERGEAQPTFQLLIYPAVDLTCSAPSHRLFASGFFLEETRIDWYLSHYVTRDEERKMPHVSPLFASSFRGLAPAIVVTAGFDPLRDEGEQYAEALRGAGNPVIYRCERPLIHGFFNMTGVVREARAAQLRLAEDVRRAFASS